jgi:hypothetical protein
MIIILNVTGLYTISSFEFYEICMLRGLEEVKIFSKWIKVEIDVGILLEYVAS